MASRLLHQASAQLRSLRGFLARRLPPGTLKIGMSARLYHPAPDAKGLRSKTMQYLEQSAAHWVMSRDVLVLMVPTVDKDGLLHRSNIRVADYARHLDGLVLQGGSDVNPHGYGEEPLDKEWEGDRLRDVYEMELLHEFIEARKPVLGICRGLQIINVAFGGTLVQDIARQLPQAQAHVTEHYDQHTHDVRFEPGSGLARLYPGVERARVTSIHHQAIKNLGRNLAVEAWSEPDGLIEAVRGTGTSHVFAVQWHPEFHLPGARDLLDCTPILDEFLAAARGAG
ncbi:MAG TPA: gamma-glutamyl-gamma-aminobutyrate hydrolase family protein [Burkholderiales bacterium]|nr:gamma-glutamyl-gamma-aminobutyrate hydrolase family protein [Burkholderiales bacterium]